MASLGVLAAGVGHEINNPLNFILNGIKGLEKKVQEGKLNKHSAFKPFFDIVYEGVNRTSAIVKSLSHFSRTGFQMDEVVNIH